MVQLFADNDVRTSIGEKSFYATAAEQNRDAAAMAAVRIKYPYPPANCEQAMSMLQNLETEITTTNEKIASGVSNRPAKRSLDALLTVRTEMQNWINAKKCIDQALKQEDAEFQEQLQQALNQEQDTSTGKKTIDNAIIFGVLGILLVGGLVIILKAKRS